MDYVTSKIREEKDLYLALGQQRAYAEYCRLEVEYALAFLLGYLWNKNLSDTEAFDDDTCENIFHDITRPSIGTIVDICRRLDLNGEIFHRGIFKSAIKYTKIRNAVFGHGFLFPDKIDTVIDELKDLLDKIFSDGNILAQEIQLIQVLNVDSHNAKGIRFSPDKSKHAWQCSTAVFSFSENNVYAMFGPNAYIRVSPFIHIANDCFFVYKSVQDILTGRTIYNQLFHTGSAVECWHDFTMDLQNDGVRRTSTNGTVLNVYKENFTHYIDMAFKEKIKDFLVNNRATVCATVWGHGGTGKTATVQSVCNDMSLGHKYFDYIVFASAKDRMFNYLLGNISTIEDPIDSYSQLIGCIKSTIRAEGEGLGEIVDFDGKLLIVIDDYETFAEDDQSQITEFVAKLDTNRHKVIITTRAAAMTTGERIDTHELNEREAAEFLRQILLSDEFSGYLLPSDVDFDAPETQQKIHEITSGRPLFIFQFAHTLVQSGIHEALSVEFKSQGDAIEFLYGRIVSYLSREAKVVFCAAGQLLSGMDLTNLLSKLRYVVNMDDNRSVFDNCIQQMVALRIIEIVRDNLFAVYAAEILDIMRKEFLKLSSDIKGNITNRLNQVKTDKSLDVEEALLRHADNARIASSASDVEAMYREILNREENSPIGIRSRAMRKLASYFLLERDNRDAAIELLEQYRHEFQHDTEVTKMLANSYWEGREVSRAIDVLTEHFGPRIWERNGRESSPELLGLCLMFRSRAVMERWENLEARRLTEGWNAQRVEGQRRQVIQDFRSLFNRFGRPLFRRVVKSGVDRMSPGERHNIVTGLYHFSGVCLRFDERETARDVCQFALETGKTGTMTKEFRRRLESVTQRQRGPKERRSRFPRPQPSSAMSEAFVRAGHQG